MRGLALLLLLYASIADSQPGILWSRLVVPNNTILSPLDTPDLIGAVALFPDTTAVVILAASTPANLTANPCALANSTVQCQQFAGLVSSASAILIVPDASTTPVVNFTLHRVPANSTLLVAVLISELPLFWSASFTRPLLFRTTVAGLRNLTSLSLNASSVPACTYSVAPSGPVCMRCANVAPNSSTRVQWTPDWYVNDTCAIIPPPTIPPTSSITPTTTTIATTITQTHTSYNNTTTTTTTITQRSSTPHPPPPSPPTLPPTTTPEPLPEYAPPLLWIIIAASAAVLLTLGLLLIYVTPPGPHRFLATMYGSYTPVPTADLLDPPDNENSEPLTLFHPSYIPLPPPPLIGPDGTIRVKIH